VICPCGVVGVIDDKPEILADSLLEVAKPASDGIPLEVDVALVERVAVPVSLGLLVVVAVDADPVADSDKALVLVAACEALELPDGIAAAEALAVPAVLANTTVGVLVLVVVMPTVLLALTVTVPEALDSEAATDSEAEALALRDADALIVLGAAASGDTVRASDGVAEGKLNAVLVAL
jgi:hypothetical protein